MKATILIFSSLFMTMTLMSGCVYHKFVMPDPSITPDRNNKSIPLTAGLFLSEDIKNYEWKQEAGAYHCRLEMGKALSKGAGVTVSKAFNHMVVLDNPDPKQARENIDVFIYPEIIYVDIDWRDVASGISVLKSQIKIKWTIKNQDAQIIFMNTFTGEENWPGRVGIPCKKGYEAFNKAMEQHFNNTLTGILSSPWWKSQKNQ
jgi:hypothetical protein